MNNMILHYNFMVWWSGLGQELSGHFRAGSMHTGLEPDKSEVPRHTGNPESYVRAGP